MYFIPFKDGMYFLYTQEGLILMLMLLALLMFYILCPSRGFVQHLVWIIGGTCWIFLALMWRGFL